ncbi:MAG: hypothetical protein EA425_18440 [Puniceicoccaceae bacterium]|nr:MAG: hypothetical protein EA425_18440 [Puniceicoccaceae bacterium]
MNLFRLIAFAAFATVLPAAELIWIDGHPAAADRILLRFKAPAAEAAGTAEADPASFLARLGLPEGVRLRPPPGQSALLAHSGGPGPAAAPFLLLELNGRLSPNEALAHLEGHPDVLVAEPDWLGTGGEIAAPASEPPLTLTWPAERLDLASAWTFTRGSRSVTVALLDTGINPFLPAFTGRLVPGFNFVNDSTNTSDDHGHGTRVAGILAAHTHPDGVTTGVDWHCRILPVKVLDANNTGFYSHWAAGVLFAAEAGADIILLTAGGFADSDILGEAIQTAVDRGCVFITIAHNDATGAIRFPGRHPAAITVGSTEADDSRSVFSNWGPALDLVAPGGGVRTVNRFDQPVLASGTSFAAPQVAGTAALLLSIRPGLDQHAVLTLLAASAADALGDPDDLPGWDPHFGWGRIQSAHAIRLAAGSLQPPLIGSDQIVLVFPEAPAPVVAKDVLRLERFDPAAGWHTVPVSPAFSESGLSWTLTGPNGPAASNLGLFRLSILRPPRPRRRPLHTATACVTRGRSSRQSE